MVSERVYSSVEPPLPRERRCNLSIAGTQIHIGWAAQGIVFRVQHLFLGFIREYVFMNKKIPPLSTIYQSVSTFVCALEVVSLVPESLFLGEASRVGVIHVTSVHRVHIVVVGIAGFAILGPEAKLRHRQELELLVHKSSHQPCQ